MMEFYPFMEKIKAEIKKLCGKDCTVETKEILENNGTVNNGMTIKRTGVKEFPVISLDAYYEQYLEGLSIHEAVQDIWDMFNSYEVSEVEESVIMDFKGIQDKIIFKLVSYERNQKLLENRPYVMVCDLAVIFSVLLKRDEKGQMTVPINNAHLEIWGITEKELYTLAKKNTPKLYYAELIHEDVEGVYPPLFYVLSNTSFINGATVILYEGLLKSIADEMESDLILLPSSIHEILILPDIKGLDIKEIGEIVKFINGNEVAVKDVLSDHVYQYDRKRDEIYLADADIWS